MNCQPPLDAYVSVFLGNEIGMNGLSHVELATRCEEIANIIRDHPLNVLILDQPASNLPMMNMAYIYRIFHPTSVSQISRSIIVASILTFVRHDEISFHPN